MEPLELFSQIQPLIQKEIKDSINKFDRESQFRVVDIPAHTHNGVDSARIDFEYLSGVPVIATAPTDKPVNGTIRLYDASGTRRLYAFIAGVWYSTTLT